MRRLVSAGLKPSLALALLLAGLGGCAGEPPPEVWAASVCSALTPWRTEINALTKRTQQQQEAAPNTAQAKENLTRLFASAETATESARSKVVAAGAPDVTDGPAIAASFVTSLAGVRDAYAHAKNGISAITATENKDFSDQVAAVLDTLNSEYAKTAPDLGKLQSVELREAFEEVPECR
ncbi:hypothetical protein F4553_004703 [Allocatelliglobosispora scoriae]|uniref:Lipoprotein n=1 Tax=Allocatelliglobosispora scoriae TaxID=643052 RepID=A0A841BSX6_9ACTN|nr:hypothetical protein [Allocatelliglobosispora scoriae]MBB5871324.1 hypothetical protein [Allocatelliglobosispora scoriae]